MSAADYPALVSSLVLIDPVIIAPGFAGSSRKVLAAGALKRRNEWPSRYVVELVRQVLCLRLV